MYKRIQTVENYLQAGPDGLASSVLYCPLCGRQHCVPIAHIRVGDGLIETIPNLAGKILGCTPKRIAVIYDRAIEEIINAAVFDRLPGLPLERMGLGKKGLLLDSTDSLGDETAAALPSDVDLILGAGSGVISDLTKWIATRVDKPFVLYGTAPSMNAHTSITSTMTIAGIKTSRLLRPADAVLFDVPTLAAAPRPMLLAGLGDLMARASCNVDWFLGASLRSRYFCPLPCYLTAKYEPVYFNLAGEIANGQPQAVRVLSEAILISGISMTMLNGDTSPSSGTEHALSHFWDLQVQLEHAPKNLHGTQVAIATVLAYALLETLMDLPPERLNAALLRSQPDREIQKLENRRKFGDKADQFNAVIDQKWLPEAEYAVRMAELADGWQRLWAEAGRYLTPGGQVLAALRSAGFKLSLDEVRRTPRQVLDSLIYGNRYRTRYTMLDLANEVGVLPNRAEEILERSGLVK